MWNIDEKPDDMPLEEWLWITRQKKSHKHPEEDDSESI